MSRGDGPIRVVLFGATGKVGRELVRGIQKDSGFRLVGALGRTGIGEDAGLFVGAQAAGIKIVGDLKVALDTGPVDVLIDFSRAEPAREAIRMALERRLPVVSGTTGFSPEDLRGFEALSYERGVGAAIISNFAIGAMLLARFAEQARRFLPKVEVVEMHHETKVDAPSGTALRLAKRLEAVGPGPVPVHSLRVPGAVAHHEVVFGGPGQLLTIRHDSLSRESFVPGVLLAARKVRELRGVVYDLDEIVGP